MKNLINGSDPVPVFNTGGKEDTYLGATGQPKVVGSQMEKMHCDTIGALPLANPPPPHSRAVEWHACGDEIADETTSRLH